MMVPMKLPAKADTNHTQPLKIALLNLETQLENAVWWISQKDNN